MNVGGSASKAPKKKEGPSHSLDTEGRSKKSGSKAMRSAATVRRLRMYNDKPVKDKSGNKVKPFQSKDLPDTRIVPDRRWFGNTRTVGQQQLDEFRRQVAETGNDPFAVMIKDKKLPMALAQRPESAKQKRSHVLRSESFEHTFGPRMQRKRPKSIADDVEELAEQAKAKQTEYQKRSSDPGETPNGDAFWDGVRDAPRSVAFSKGQSKRIWSELYKVIDSSDVVVQVVDARDPDGTRSPFLERYVKNKCTQKHMVVLLNKCDLVPSYATKRWLRRISKTFPVLAFRASITHPFGKGDLLSLLRQFARVRRDRQSISVGFVGYPNVGKSSVINTIRGKPSCGVAPIPGETKVWQFLTLTTRVHLIDCPGVVYHREGDSDTDAVLKGVVRVTDLEDPTEHISAILDRIKPKYIRKKYGVTEWASPEDFLEKLARRTGKLHKGAEPDLMTAAKTVLLDWQKGKIPFFELPADDDENDGPSERGGPPGSGDGPSEEENPEARSKAASASGRQMAKEIPVKEAFFDEGDENQADKEEDDGDDEPASDAEHEEPSRGEEDEGDESDGYGDDGLSWEAVMNDVANLPNG